MEKIWEDEPYLPPPAADSLSVSSDGIDRPSTPAKKARIGIGALWGTVSRSLSNGSAQEKPAAAESHKPKEASTTDSKPPLRRLPPPPPPRHPGHSATPPPPPPRRHPPPASTTATSEPSTIVAPIPVHPPAGPPPPLPKRNRQRTESPAVPQEPSAEEKVSVPAATEGSDTTAAALSPPEESHDEFKTPVEDLPGPPLGLVNAANVPLPPSPPSSNPPSRVASPAPGVTTAPVHPVPPPLPRRAAARARPSSIGLNPPITASSDEPAPEREAGETTDNKVEEKVDEAAQELKPEENSPSEAHENVEDAKEELETKEIVEEETHADPDGEMKDEEHAPPAYDEVPASEHVEEKTQSPVQAAQALEDEKSSSDPVETSDKVGEMDTRMYVGIATWEERTWRELMKLREDMFWARVGGVR